MSEGGLEEDDTSGFVRRRILREWRDDIEVIAVTTRRKRLVGKKQILVEIGCRSRIACEQARISLAGFVAHDASDWDASHWEVIEDSRLPFRIRLIEPNPDGYYVRGE